ncbi:MAG: hypothetical protein ACRETL_09155, partial [Gammaproteobacteria bacterium]
MDSDRQRVRRARRTEVALITLAAVAAVTALKEAQAFFIPVFVGVIGAYALRPIVNQLAAWKLPEGVAA